MSGFPFDGGPKKDSDEVKQLRNRVSCLTAEADHFRQYYEAEVLKNADLVAELKANRDWVASLEAAARGKWLPIESAPKDGRMFLAYYSERKHAGPSVGAMQWATWIKDHKERHFHSWSVLSESKFATHWMPLPVPPATDDPV